MIARRTAGEEEEGRDRGVGTRGWGVQPQHLTLVGKQDRETCGAKCQYRAGMNLLTKALGNGGWAVGRGACVTVPVRSFRLSDAPRWIKRQPVLSLDLSV